jgi:hypothetical protein
LSSLFEAADLEDLILSPAGGFAQSFNLQHDFYQYVGDGFYNADKLRLLTGFPLFFLLFV